MSFWLRETKARSTARLLSLPKSSARIRWNSPYPSVVAVRAKTAGAQADSSVAGG